MYNWSSAEEVQLQFLTKCGEKKMKRSVESEIHFLSN